MCYSHSRGNGWAQNAREIDAGTGFLRSWFDHVEDRPCAAVLTGVDYFEVDADDGIVFKHDTAQFRSVDDQVGAFEARRRAELHAYDGMICQGQLHGFSDGESYALAEKLVNANGIEARTVR